MDDILKIVFKIKKIYIKVLYKYIINDTRPIVLSTSIYYYLKNKGKKVYADLSYFDKPKHIATEGKIGDISHWDWQLIPFGIFKSSFDNINNNDTNKYNYIYDGIEKTRLAFEALQTESIKKIFFIKQLSANTLVNNLGDYLCIHIRRGDYINVASYLIDDDLFIDIAKKFHSLINSIVIVSDSKIDKKYREQSLLYFKEVILLDEINEFDAHKIMRNARILICSNSQFSLIAGLLSTKALVFLPKKWYSDGNQINLKYLELLCKFQVL